MNKSKELEKHYKALGNTMYWYVLKKVGSKEIAEDLTSDLFIKLYENPEIMSERDDEGVKAWLYRVAYNMIVDRSRRLKNKNKEQMPDEEFVLIDNDQGEYLENEIKSEKDQIVRAALEILAPKEQEMIYFRYREEMEYKVIGEIMDLKEGAVKMRIYRCLEKLKDHLGDRVE